VALARRVAADPPCAQRRDIRLLRRRATALVRGGRVPTALERPLLDGVAALAADSPPCLSAVPAATPPPRRPPPPRERRHGHGEDHGRHGGHGDGRDHGRGEGDG
jgi:hypothetical protein